MRKHLLANISWNPFKWQQLFVNPKAGHKYAKTKPGHESLNFLFNKKGIDSSTEVLGYVRWKYAPLNFQMNGLIIFFSKDTENNLGKIVGIYGGAEIFESHLNLKLKGFARNIYKPNLKAKKNLSMLFPIPLNAEAYKTSSNKRLVGQIGFSYIENNLAQTIISDELTLLYDVDSFKPEYEKLFKIYEYYFGPFQNKDAGELNDREQNEIINHYAPITTREELLNELSEVTKVTSQYIIINHKAYRRDNKAIAIIKLLRGLKCQICANYIKKKDGKNYVEAAHITPKHKNGNETPENILILCPNHHKEFDLGDRKIIERQNGHIIFNLNNKRYDLSLHV